MRKLFNISFAAVAVLALALACNKEVTTIPENNPDVTPAVEIVTIKATLSDALTRVDFTPTISGGKTTAMALAWAEGDKVRVFNHGNREQYDDFTLAAEAVGEKVGVFTGTPTHLAGATSYDVEVINVIGNEEVTDGIINNSYDFYINQTQPKDGDPGDLKYFAKVKDINDYSDILFDEVSGVLAISAKLPEGVAATIKSVDFIAGETIFPGDKELTIILTEKGDVGNDNVLNLFATLDTEGVPFGGQPINLIVRFNAPGTGHTVYTRYVVLDSPIIYPNSLNTININATESDVHAGQISDDGSADYPYLIADKYQLMAMADLMVAGETTYFKLVDDIDMDNESWTRLNPDPFTAAVFFDGNDKTISNLNDSMFQDFNGTARDLTISGSEVDTNSGEITGVFANTIYTAPSSITNVDVSSSHVSTDDKAYCGGLIGQIGEPGHEANVAGTLVSNCDVENTSVSGTLAGGVIGFANALVTMSGCTFTGGTVTASARYCGGMLGSTGNFNSVFSDCHVEDATITSSATADVRTGGFVGQLHTKCQVKGCSVGTNSQRVTVSLATPAKSDSKLNAGGFAGTSYGTITKNGDVHSTAFVTITCSNPSAQANADYQLNLGGFAGYHQGTIEYCDADVMMTGICGKYVGGFCGLQNGGTIRYSTSTGSVSGNTGVGGFVGYINDRGSTLTECSSSATVSRTGTWGGSYGVFAGIVDNATMTHCFATADIGVSANYVGGFIGGIETSSGKTATISQCWSTGDVASASAQCGGFIAHIAAKTDGTVRVQDCYETGNLTGGNQRKGGFIGQINSGIVTVSRCYSTASLSGSFAQGGLVGFMNASATVEDCAAWNPSVTAASIGNGNWSSGAVIGVAWPVATLTNNFRKPDLSIKAYWGNVSGYTKELTATYDHPDVSSSNPLIVVDKTDGSTLRSTTATAAASGQDNYPLFAYHGKHVASGTTLSTLASTAKENGGLGWSGDVWDFTGSMPTLR